MNIMFAMGMEEALDQIQELNCRVAYQDDACFFAQASDLIQHWPRLTEALEQLGHRMRQPRCTFWAPLCDTLRPERLPRPIAHLATLITRKTGGMLMLGSAAQGELAIVLAKRPQPLEPVSYPPLTLPTKRQMSIPEVAL